MITASLFKPGVLKALILSMNAPEEHVIRLHYKDKAGVTTERIVSPIRFIGDTAMLALCLSREEPRRFELEMCSKIELLSANDVLMPIEMRIVSDNGNKRLGDKEQDEGARSQSQEPRDRSSRGHRAAMLPRPVAET